MWHGISMADPMVDQMTRLRLKLLEKRLENERDMDGRAESAQSTRSHNGQNDALHNALRRKRNLLQRLKEQHMLEEVTRPHTWGGTRGRYPSHLPPAPQPPPPVAPIHIHQLQPAPPILPLPSPAPPLPPRIIQQTMPQQPTTIIQQLPQQQPTTIIQQLPQQQPLISQIPPPQPYPAPRSGSIKEDMVEMMLMQNAQMHQIIMQNMMIKALPPMALSSPGGASHSVPHTPQYGQDKGRGSAVHHHHYGPTAATHPLPPIGYSVWPQMVSTVPGGQGTHVPSIHHVTGPVTLPPLNI